MGINWKVRLKNKVFWVAIIPAVLLLVQLVAGLFGYTLELGEIGNKLIDIVNAVFVILTLMGVVADPTTEGMTDSLRAMGYKELTDSDYKTINEKIGGSD